MASYIIVDVESDGEYPESFTGYSMVCFGAIIVDSDLNKTFYGQTKPISKFWKPDALAISGFTRDEHNQFNDPKQVMIEFDQWIKENSKGHPIFVSDNLAYDWQFINYYFHKYLGKNPFGYSGRRIGDMWCGFNNDMRLKWRHLRKTNHSHNPVDDARGNAEAMLEMQRLGLNLGIK